MNIINVAKELIGKLKNLIENKIHYWYFILFGFAVFSVVNYGLLNMLIPDWICHMIFIVLLILFTYYVATAYNYIKEKYKLYINNKKDCIFEKISLLQSEINDLYDQNRKEQKDSFEKILENSNDNACEVISIITNSFDLANEEIKNQLKENHNNVIDKFEMNQKHINIKFDEQNASLTSTITEKYQSTNDKIDNNKNIITDLINKGVSETNVQDLANANLIIETLKIDNNAIKETNNNEFVTVRNMINKINDDIFNRVSSVETELSSEITLTGNEVKDIITSLNKDLTDSKSSIVDNICETSNTLRDKLQNISLSQDNISSKIDESKREVKEIIDEKESNIINTVISSQAETVSKIQFFEDKISDNFNVIEISMKNMCNDISNAIMQCDDNIIENTTKNTDKILTSLDNTSKMQNDNYNSLYSQIESKIVEIQNILDEKSKTIIEKTQFVQNELLKAINKLLEEQGENYKHINSGIDNIVSETSKYSNMVGIRLKDLEDAINTLYERLNSNLLVLLEEEKIQKQNNVIILDSIKNNKEYYSKHQATILNEIENLNLLLETIKNISVLFRETLNDRPSSSSFVSSVTDANRRVERIKDDISGNVVENHYVNEQLVISKIFKGDSKVYEAEYGTNGNVVKSRSFNEKGNVISEIEFYPNGEVKARIEKIKEHGQEKTVISKFDIRGNKIS